MTRIDVLPRCETGITLRGTSHAVPALDTGKRPPPKQRAIRRCQVSSRLRPTELGRSLRLPGRPDNVEHSGGVAYGAGDTEVDTEVDAEVGLGPLRPRRDPALRRFEAVHALGPCLRRCWWDLLDSHTRDGSADHQLLDLLSSFEDLEALIWTTPLVTDIALCAP